MTYLLHRPYVCVRVRVRVRAYVLAGVRVCVHVYTRVPLNVYFFHV